ncbi:MAG: hypothetical protein DFNUSKGM_002289 [Candidatus Fervidibacter sacchari]
MKDEDLLIGFTEEEKEALREIRRLAEAGDIAKAVQKASETFWDGQGIGVALRIGIVTPAVRRGQPFEEVCERVREAISNIEDPQQRSRFETALQAYQEVVEEFKRAVRAVAGIWADHPDFEGKGVREWRRKLWDTKKEA